MTQPEQREFLWTFPIYLLAGECEQSADGELAFTEDTAWIAPTMSDGKSYLAVFTDREGAEAFRERYAELSLEIIELNPLQALIVLKVIGPGFPAIAIDPMASGTASVLALTSELVNGIEAHYGPDIPQVCQVCGPACYCDGG